MTITPTNTGYMLAVNYKGRAFVADCETQADCWIAAVEWMMGL